MAATRSGPGEVRPNTLQGQSMPNTFRSRTGAATSAKQYGNGRPRSTALRAQRLSVPHISLRIVLGLAVVLVFVAIFFLSPTR